MEEPQKRKTGEKTLRIGVPTHEKFIAMQHDLRARNADELVALLIAENTVKIPLNDTVRGRWTEAAKEAGYELDHWIALIIESYIAYGASPGRIEMTLNRSLGILARAAAALERPEQGGSQSERKAAN